MGKEALLDAAFDVLAATGTLRPEAVAREAGVSKALVFHHFRTAVGLEEAMVERILRETQAGLDSLANEYPNPRLRLDALARALLAQPPEPPLATRRVLRFWLADDERARLRDTLLADFIAQTLREMRGKVDPEEVASLVLARWHGITARHAHGARVDHDREAARLARELDALLG